MSDNIIGVDPMDSDKMNSIVVSSLDDLGTVKFDEEGSQCHWNDAVFPDGAKICDNGIAYECQMGHWLKLSTPC